MGGTEGQGQEMPRPKTREELEKVAGEIIAPGAKTDKPKAEISYDSLQTRKQSPPEMQYAMMKQHYRDNTDINAFITSGEVSETIAAVCFYRRPNAPGKFTRAPRFVSAAELQGATDAYFELMYEAACDGSEMIPDVEHYRLFIGVSKSTVTRWAKEEPEYGAVVEEAYDRILAIKKQLAMHNKIPQLVYMNDIQNNHGYRSKDKKEEERVEEKIIPNIDELIEKAKYLPG